MSEGEELKSRTAQKKARLSGEEQKELTASRGPRKATPTAALMALDEYRYATWGGVPQAPSLSESAGWLADLRAAEKRAAVEREQVMIAELTATRQALDASKGRERLLLRVTVATGVFGAVSAIAAVVAVF